MALCSLALAAENEWHKHIFAPRESKVLQIPHAYFPKTIVSLTHNEVPINRLEKVVWVEDSFKVTVLNEMTNSEGAEVTILDERFETYNNSYVRAQLLQIVSRVNRVNHEFKVTVYSLLSLEVVDQWSFSIFPLLRCTNFFVTEGQFFVFCHDWVELGSISDSRNNPLTVLAFRLNGAVLALKFSRIGYNKLRYYFFDQASTEQARDVTSFSNVKAFATSRNELFIYHYQIDQYTNAPVTVVLEVKINVRKKMIFVSNKPASFLPFQIQHIFKVTKHFYIFTTFTGFSIVHIYNTKEIFKLFEKQLGVKIIELKYNRHFYQPATNDVFVFASGKNSAYKLQFRIDKHRCRLVKKTITEYRQSNAVDGFIEYRKREIRMTQQGCIFVIKRGLSPYVFYKVSTQELATGANLNRMAGALKLPGFTLKDHPLEVLASLDVYKILVFLGPLTFQIQSKTPSQRLVLRTTQPGLYKVVIRDHNPYKEISQLAYAVKRRTLAKQKPESRDHYRLDYINLIMKDEKAVEKRQKPLVYTYHIYVQENQAIWKSHDLVGADGDSLINLNGEIRIPFIEGNFFICDQTSSQFSLCEFNHYPIPVSPDENLIHSELFFDKNREVYAYVGYVPKSRHVVVEIERRSGVFRTAEHPTVEPYRFVGGNSENRLNFCKKKFCSGKLMRNLLNFGQPDMFFPNESVDVVLFDYNHQNVFVFTFRGQFIKVSLWDEISEGLLSTKVYRVIGAGEEVVFIHRSVHHSDYLVFVVKSVTSGFVHSVVFAHFEDIKRPNNDLISLHKLNIQSLLTKAPEISHFQVSPKNIRVVDHSIILLLKDQHSCWLAKFHFTKAFTVTLQDLVHLNTFFLPEQMNLVDIFGEFVFEIADSIHKGIVLLLQINRNYYLGLLNPFHSRYKSLKTLVRIPDQNVVPIDLHYFGQQFDPIIEVAYIHAPPGHQKTLHIVRVHEYFSIQVNDLFKVKRFVIRGLLHSEVDFEENMSRLFKDNSLKLEMDSEARQVLAIRPEMVNPIEIIIRHFKLPAPIHSFDFWTQLPAEKMEGVVYKIPVVRCTRIPATFARIRPETRFMTAFDQILIFDNSAAYFYSKLGQLEKQITLASFLTTSPGDLASLTLPWSGEATYFDRSKSIFYRVIFNKYELRFFTATSKNFDGLARFRLVKTMKNAKAITEVVFEGEFIVFYGFTGIEVALINLIFFEMGCPSQIGIDLNNYFLFKVPRGLADRYDPTGLRFYIFCSINNFQTNLQLKFVSKKNNCLQEIASLYLKLPREFSQSEFRVIDMFLSGDSQKSITILLETKGRHFGLVFIPFDSEDVADNINSDFSHIRPVAKATRNSLISRSRVVRLVKPSVNLANASYKVVYRNGFLFLNAQTPKEAFLFGYQVPEVLRIDVTEKSWWSSVRLYPEKFSPYFLQRSTPDTYFANTTYMALNAERETTFQILCVCPNWGLSVVSIEKELKVVVETSRLKSSMIRIFLDNIIGRHSLTIALRRTKEDLIFGEAIREFGLLAAATLCLVTCLVWAPKLLAKA